MHFKDLKQSGSKHQYFFAEKVTSTNTTTNTTTLIIVIMDSSCLSTSYQIPVHPYLVKCGSQVPLKSSNIPQRGPTEDLAAETGHRQGYCPFHEVILMGGRGGKTKQPTNYF